MKTLNRRQIAKGLGGGIAAGLAGGVFGRSEAKAEPPAGWVQVLPGVWKSTFGTPEAITPVSTRGVAPQREKLARMAQVSMPPLPALHGTVRPIGTTLELPLAAQEQLYGFGLQFFSVQQRGKKRFLRVNADPRFDTGETHAPVPFYVSSRGYGILVDTARFANFFCGESRNKPQKAMQVAQGGALPLSTSALYSKALSDNMESQVLVDVPSAKGVDVYLFAGPTMLDAVRRYNLFSGGGMLPPEWGLGFWYRASSNAHDTDLIALAKEFRERKIPCDVLGLEGGWHTHAYSCTYSWNKDRFPDPAGFIQKLKGRDYRVNLWEHAFVHPSSPLFEEMVPLSGDKGVWGGLVPDFVDAKARMAFGDFHGRTLVDLGVDGFKLDECDSSDYTGGWSFPEVSQFPSGVDGEQMHSLFGLGYQRALWTQYEQRKKPTYNLVRSSGALAAPYPFVLYSDLYDHREFVRALVNSGFSGLLWCPEVRDAKSEEDLLRRMQTAMFSPLAMVNGWYIPNPPWKQLNRKQNNANVFMPDWERLEARCREIIGWRMQMIPYLLSAFARYEEDGTPPFRALALDWPDDPDAARVDDAWMVGDRMLVAPLFADEPGRTLVLPAGGWHDFWTGEAVAGGTKLEIAASEAKIPVFVKTGSVFPVASVSNSTMSPESRHLQVRVFGDGHLPFALRSEAGLSMTLRWDGASRKGRVEQTGPNPYVIDRWT